MKCKTLLIAAAAMSCAVNGFASPVSGEKKAARPGWKMDAPVRFQFAYLPDSKKPAEPLEKLVSMGLSAAWLPDIDNIILSNIKGLGFTLPDRPNPAQFKLYLKLFNAPAKLDDGKMAETVLGGFHLDTMPRGGGSLKAYAEKSANTAVKFGYIAPADLKFSEANPFPVPAVGRDGAFFLKNTPFFSIYVLPSEGGAARFKSEDEAAAWSRKGVLAFHEELLAHYGKTLKAAGSDKDYLFFTDGNATLKVQRKPIVIETWRDAPMPTGKKDFLTALLLIYRSQKGDGPLASETVFEVGAIVRQR